MYKIHFIVSVLHEEYSFAFIVITDYLLYYICCNTSSTSSGANRPSSLAASYTQVSVKHTGHTHEQSFLWMNFIKLHCESKYIAFMLKKNSSYKQAVS